MGEYVKSLGKEAIELYDDFYFLNIEDIAKEFNKKIECTKLENEKTKEYEEILGSMKLDIIEKTNIEMERYYRANTQNAIEIDTYITKPQNRQNGLARVVVFEGIKKQIEEHFNVENVDNKEIFLCSTLHRENLSSKYVSEFFGLLDSVYVNRRYGRNREVHITQILKDEYKEYLEKMENKLIVMYGYNPNNKVLSNKETKKVLEEQLEYENNQLINIIQTKPKSSNTNKRYTGKTLEESKIEKIEKIKRKIEKIENLELVELQEENNKSNKIKKDNSEGER